MNTLYVGIDVSSKSNVVYLMLPNGDKHSNFSVANSHDGSTQLVKRIHSALSNESLDTVVIGLEATSVYFPSVFDFVDILDPLKNFTAKAACSDNICSLFYMFIISYYPSPVKILSFAVEKQKQLNKFNKNN